MEEEEPKVAEIMESKVLAVEMNTTAKECAKAMTKRGVGCAVVVQGKAAIGIVTERDLVGKVMADVLDASKTLVRDIMSTPLITVNPEATMTEAAKLMEEYGIRRLVVIGRDGGLTGIVTAIDLAKVLARKHGYEEAALNAIARAKEGPAGGPYQ
ncbi:MAG: CBS domain-containing protein [Nitrososphaerales archaeon]|nr:CBS domain-containing protein [Nitrososphaerales archaeon]